MVFGFLKRKKKGNRTFTLKVRAVEEVAKDAVNVIFEADPSLDYQSGQFITIIDKVKGEKIRRAYSLCTSPGLDEFPAVTVKRVEGGLMSNFINDQYQPGQEVEVMEAMGKFIPDFESQKPLVLIGGGSGITPLYSIARTALSRSEGKSVTLVYGNRSEEYVIFREQLEQLAADDDNFHLIQILESDPNGIATHVGQPKSDVIAGLCKDHTNADFFICGPEPMMNEAQKGLKSLGVADGQIHIESFVSQESAPSPSSPKDVELTLTVDGSTHVLQINRKESILDQATSAGIDMPYSCKSGLCTACRGMCKSGEITAKEADGLTANEVEQGYILTCMSSPASDQIEVEIG